MELQQVPHRQGGPGAPPHTPPHTHTICTTHTPDSKTLQSLLIKLIFAGLYSPADQGQYNPLTRQVEQEVFPCCRCLGMQFYAFSPLFAGVLATSGGRSSARLDDPRPSAPTDLSAPATGRHSEPAVSVRRCRCFQLRFGRAQRSPYTLQVLREAKAGIVAACDASGLDLSQATLRWMLNHSHLGEGDGLISGVGSLDQLQENMAALTAESGPLPGPVLAAFEHGWNRVVSGPPGYPATNWFPVAKL